MKRVKTVFSALFILVLPLLFGIGCGIVITGSGNLVTEEKSFADFTKVNAGSAFDVSITRDDEYSITITADDNLMEYVQVSMTGSTLTIDTDVMTLNRVTLRAEITMPDIDTLTLSGACRGTLTGFDTTEAFSCDISGASDLSFEDITFGDITAGASGASSIDGALTCGDMVLGLSGASDADIDGQAADVTLTAEGASSAKLGGFTVANASVNISGASRATIKTDGDLNVNLSGASSLRYIGSPAVDVEGITGASSMQKVD